MLSCNHQNSPKMDRNIDESVRKPRRSKGTPFFRQRNYYALGLLGLSGVTGILYHFWGQSEKLKQNLRSGKFDYPPALQERIIRLKWNKEVGMDGILKGLEERKELREPKKETVFAKFFQKGPDL